MRTRDRRIYKEHVYLTEDDALPDGEDMIQLDEHIILRHLIPTIHIELFDILHGDLVPS